MISLAIGLIGDESAREEPAETQGRGSSKDEAGTSEQSLTKIINDLTSRGTEQLEPDFRVLNGQPHFSSCQHLYGPGRDAWGLTRTGVGRHRADCRPFPDRSRKTAFTWQYVPDQPHDR